MRVSSQAGAKCAQRGRMAETLIEPEKNFQSAPGLAERNNAEGVRLSRVRLPPEGDFQLEFVFDEF
jgi:hypothetical protein